MQSIFLNLSTMPKLKPIYGVESYTTSPWYFVILSALLIICLVAGCVIWRKYFVKPELEDKPESRTIAFNAINDLLEKKLLEDGQYKILVVELSQILRYFIEAHFAINAVDMTTEEFLAFVGVNEKLSIRTKQLEVLSGFMQACDQVKFAKYHPSHEAIEQLVEHARRFVKESEVGV